MNGISKLSMDMAVSREKDALERARVCALAVRQVSGEMIEDLAADEVPTGKASGLLDEVLKLAAALERLEAVREMRKVYET